MHRKKHNKPSGDSDLKDQEARPTRTQGAKTVMPGIKHSKTPRIDRQASKTAPAKYGDGLFPIDIVEQIPLINKQAKKQTNSLDHITEEPFLTKTGTAANPHRNKLPVINNNRKQVLDIENSKSQDKLPTINENNSKQKDGLDQNPRRIQEYEPKSTLGRLQTRHEKRWVIKLG